MRLSLTLPLTRTLVVLGVLVTLTVTLLSGPAAAEPTERQLRAQQRRAAHLQELAESQTRHTRTAQQRLATLAVKAGQALDAYVVARDQALAARAAELAERRRYEAAQGVVRTERVELGRFAASSYRNGGAMGNMAMVASLLNSRSVTEMGRSAADLKWAGTQQSHVLDRLVRAEAEASDAAAKAQDAKVRAEGAEARARDAKARADRLVSQQRSLVASLARQAARTRGAAAAARTKARQMAKARAVAAQRRREAERRRRAALARHEVVQVSGTCSGGGAASYQNGQIPRAALCPLWGADWHVLRADAAAAFNAMSKAYAERFGRPILVTDSYRSYEAQVACSQQKGDLCATPGTSNHGWGTAVDLGDGVNSFGTTTHLWMQQNAPRFGWFHPGWAEPTGDKPEPWHWEFGG